MVQGISYEAYSDTLVASTFGRGVFVMHNAKNTLATLLSDQTAGSCGTIPASPAPSSAKWLPPMHTC